MKGKTVSEENYHEDNVEDFESTPPDSEEPQEDLSELPQVDYDASGPLEIADAIPVESASASPRVKELLQEVLNGWHGKTERRLRTSLGPYYDEVMALAVKTAPDSSDD